jgi:serine/threonine protein phosphatase 1
LALKAFRALFGGHAAPRTEPGTRVYAIGDVHGRPDMLARMLDAVERHDTQRGPRTRREVVFVGDIIDRGPHSREALQVLHNAGRHFPGLVTLLGNHEEMLLRALAGDEVTIRGWMRVGGAETVESFGLAPLAEGEDAVPFVTALQRAVPSEWVEWLQSWPLTARTGDYFICHAGVKPGVALARQSRRDLLWARHEFLEDPRDHGAIIVHGHTISEEVEIRRNRIGIDTGAYRTGTLSAVCLEGTDVEVLTVHGDVTTS